VETPSREDGNSYLVGWDDVVMMTEEEEEVEEEEEEEAKTPHCSTMNNPNEQTRKAESLTVPSTLLQIRYTYLF
jgi:hypothetical protein